MASSSFKIYFFRIYNKYIYIYIIFCCFFCLANLCQKNKQTKSAPKTFLLVQKCTARIFYWLSFFFIVYYAIKNYWLSSNHMIIAQSGQIFFFPFNKKKTKKRKEIKKQKTKDPRQKSKFNDTIEGSTLRLMLLLLLYCTRLRHVEKWHKRKTVLSTRSRRCATLRRQIPSTSCTRMIGLCYFLSSKRNEKIKKRSIFSL